MATPLSPQRVKVLELLLESPTGVWREELIDKAGRLIPPGKAWRKWQVVRRGNSVKSGSPQSGDPEAVRSGRRAMVQDIITSLVQDGIAAYSDSPEVGNRWVWLRNCPTCHRPF